MTFKEAQQAFENAPYNQTAGAYLAAAMQYEADGMIGDDTWLNALAEIRDYLLKGPTITITVFSMKSTDEGSTIVESRDEHEFWDIAVKQDGKDDPIEEVDDITDEEVLQKELNRLHQKYPNASWENVP
ncbi:hypothetical protein [Mesorhizobium sp. CN2-181]|uniref:hypothetical protein n=1 Tax=Mesorhizobium yinganensis TaxID=3157707 RepID=UPI0032B84E6C